MTGNATVLNAQVNAEASDAEPKINHDTELLRVWFEITNQIKNGEPWDVISLNLGSAIEQYPNSKHINRCRNVLASIDAAQKPPPTQSKITNDSSIPELIDTLHLAKPNYRMVIAPNQYYESVGQFVWEYYLERETRFSPDPAHLLRTRGRPALEPLLELLDDPRATRGVGTSDDGFAQPLVICVSDVALGLIESISGCTFKMRRGDLQLISERSKKDRAAINQLVREWHKATKTMTPTQAVLWQIENGPKKLRIYMIDTLIAKKQNAAALSYLQENYLKKEGDSQEDEEGHPKQGAPKNGEIDIALAGRMVRAGSREPLDFIHKLVAKGRPVDREVIRLVAHFGDSRDFQLLVRLVESAAQKDDRESAQLLQMTVDALRSANDRQATMSIPVHVSIIKTLSNEWEPLLSANPPQHAFLPLLETSVRAIQNASGIHFGLADESDTIERARACREILTWWEKEGEGAYGLEQNKPHAPVGIR